MLLFTFNPLYPGPMGGEGAVGLKKQIPGNSWESLLSLRGGSRIGIIPAQQDPGPWARFPPAAAKKEEATRGIERRA